MSYPSNSIVYRSQHLAFVLLCFTWPVIAAPKSASSRRCGNNEALDERTQRCYPLGERGPCGEFMVFKRLELKTRIGLEENFWDNYQVDDYDDEEEDRGDLREELIFVDSEPRPTRTKTRSSNNAYAGVKLGQCECGKVFGPRCSARPLVHFRRDGRCYPIYSQGPCRRGEWLTRGRDGLARCERSRCANRIVFNQSAPSANVVSSLTEFVFPHNGTCYQTFTQAFCPPGEVALFPDPRKVEPRCFPADDGACPTDRIIGSNAPLPCKNGTTPSHDGECRDIADFK